MELPAKESHSVHVMSDQTSMQWLHDGKAVIITLTSDKRKAIDDWYEIVAAVAASWNPDETYLAVYDLTDVGLTPYFRKRSIDVAQAVSNLRGRYAVIIPDGDSSASVMRLYFETVVSQASKRQGRIFDEVDSAIRWLEELR